MKPSDEAILETVQHLISELDPPRCAALEKALALRDLSFAATPNEYTAEIMFSGGVFPRKDGRVRVLGPSVVEDYEVTSSIVSQAYQMAGFQSSCGTTTEVIQRYAGINDPVIYEWYADRVNRGKYAVMQEKVFAEQQGAWVSALPWVEGTTLPDPGDACIVGLRGDPNFARGNVFNTEHEFTAVSWLDGYLHSIDGGQPGIHLRTRGVVEVWTSTDGDGRRTGELWAASVNPDGTVPLGGDGRPLNGRRFLGFGRLDALPVVSDAPSCGGGGGLFSGGGGSSIEDAGDVAEAVGKGLFVSAVGTGLVVAGRKAWKAWKRYQQARARKGP